MATTRNQLDQSAISEPASAAALRFGCTCCDTSTRLNAAIAAIVND